MGEFELARWPKPAKPQRGTSRRYRVRYDLAYDGGGSAWDGFYRTRLGARVAVFWNRYLASWGGSAVLYDRRAVPESPR